MGVRESSSPCTHVLPLCSMSSSSSNLSMVADGSRVEGEVCPPVFMFSLCSDFWNQSKCWQDDRDKVCLTSEGLVLYLWMDALLIGSTRKFINNWGKWHKGEVTIGLFGCKTDPGCFFLVQWSALVLDIIWCMWISAIFHTGAAEAAVTAFNHQRTLWVQRVPMGKLSRTGLLISSYRVKQTCGLSSIYPMIVLKFATEGVSDFDHFGLSFFLMVLHISEDLWRLTLNVTRLCSQWWWILVITGLFLLCISRCKKNIPAFTLFYV